MTLAPRITVTKAVFVREVQLIHSLPDERIVFGQSQFRQVGMALAQPHQSDEVADVDGALDSRDQGARRRDGHVDAPRLAEQPLVSDVVDSRHHPRHPELGLGQQTHDEVGLVVAGGGDQHVAGLHARLLQRRQLARVGEQPVRVGNGVWFEVAPLPFDQQDLVAVVEQLPRDGTADIARAGNPDPHPALRHRFILTHRRRSSAPPPASTRRARDPGWY